LACSCRDDAYHERVGSQILYWLDARPTGDYRERLPLVRDRPAEREPLLRLDTVLQALERTGMRVPTPRTWVMPLDSPLPEDLIFPLFVRTATPVKALRPERGPR
jgi:hypothetical protein